MKKCLFTIAVALMLMTQVGFAQYKGAHGITFKYLGVDTYSPYAGMDANDVPNYKFTFTKDAIDELDMGVEVGYFYGVTDWLAIGAPFRMGKITYRNNDFGTLSMAGNDELFLSLDARVRVSAFFKEKQFVIPYVTTGLGGMLVDREFDMQIPLGMGLNFRLARNFYLEAQTEYRLSFDEMQDANVYSFTNNMHHSVGFLFQLGDRQEEETPPPPPEPEPEDRDEDGVIDAEDTCPDVAGLAKFGGCPDTDGDDIQDSEDACPEVAGTAAFKGCPDTDGDGLADNEDDCPNEAGTLANKGCPVKDRDNDGVNDDADNCPDTPGVAAFNGCPDTDGDGVADKDDKCASTPGLAKFNGCPDSDNDGVEDAKDKCPNKAGTIANNGCPEIKKEEKEKLEFAAKAVEFETGKDVIRTVSYPSLDEIAAILKKYPNYNVSISGYTDSVGSADKNKALSERRARACLEYLAGKGIERNRMSATGYGEENPIATNDTKEGRQKNRRVEFYVYPRK